MAGPVHRKFCLFVKDLWFVTGGQRSSLGRGRNRLEGDRKVMWRVPPQTLEKKARDRVPWGDEGIPLPFLFLFESYNLNILEEMRRNPMPSPKRRSTPGGAPGPSGACQRDWRGGREKPTKGLAAKWAAAERGMRTLGAGEEKVNGKGRRMGKKSQNFRGISRHREEARAKNADFDAEKEKTLERRKKSPSQKNAYFRDSES